MRTYIQFPKLAYKCISQIWIGLIALVLLWGTPTKGQTTQIDTTFKYQWGFAVQPAYYFRSASHHGIYPWVEWKGAFGGAFRFYFQESLSDWLIYETGLGFEALPYQMQLDKQVTIPNVAGVIPMKWNRYSYEFSCLQIPLGIRLSNFWYRNRAFHLGLGLQAKLLRNVYTTKNITVTDSLGSKIEVFNAYLYPDGPFRGKVQAQLAAYLKGGIQFRDKAKKRQYYINAYLQFSPWNIGGGFYNAQDGNVLGYGLMYIRQNSIGIEMGIGFNHGIKLPPPTMESDPNLKR